MPRAQLIKQYDPDLRLDGPWRLKIARAMVSILNFNSLPFFPTVKTNTRIFIVPYFYSATTGIAFNIGHALSG